MIHDLPSGMDSTDTNPQQPERAKAAHLMASVSGLMAVLYTFGLIKVDQWTIILVLMAFLPWLGFFVSEFSSQGVKLPHPKSGPVEETAFNTPVQNTSLLGFGALSFEAKVVLRTLNHYQPSVGSGQKWAFTVPFGHPLHIQFMLGVMDLAKQGLIEADRGSGRVGLSDAGIKFCQENSVDLGKWEQKFTF